MQNINFNQPVKDSNWIMNGKRGESTCNNSMSRCLLSLAGKSSTG